VTNQIVKALENGARKMGKAIGEDAGKAVKEFYQDTGKRLKKVADNHVENDAKHAAEMEKILKGGAKEDLPHAPGGLGGTGSHTRNGSGEKPSLGGSGRPGQSSGGNGSCRTGGDPVDVVSGQMITSATDLELPGLLPLVLRRAYASSYRGGRLHGPGWSSSIDQRVEIDLNGIHYAGDDAQILHYPLPTVSGQPVLPQHGARWPLTWDRATDTIRIEDPDRGWTRHFARPDVAPAPTSGTETRPITALSDRNDHRITFVHDDVGCPAEVRHTGGYRIAVDVIPTPAGPRIESLRVLDGTGYGQGTTIVGYRYYPDGRLAEVVNSSGLPYVYEYDDADRITAWIDRNGQSYEYVYDDAGRVTHGVGQAGYLSAAFRYDTVQRVTTVTDSLGHTDEYHYDEQQHVTTTVDALGHTTLTGYDEFGRVVSRTDEIGRTTRFDLNDHGDPIRITAPDDSAIALGYNELRQLVSVTQAGVLAFAFAYDSRGNLLSSNDAAGARTVRSYDEHGHLKVVTDPLGHTQHIVTNAAGLITAVTDGLGHTARATYDAFGRVAALTDPMGSTTSCTRRVEGEITELAHPDGTSETWKYDPEGNLIEHRDQADAVIRYEIGPFGRPVARTLPDGEQQLLRYDTELQLLSVTTGGAAWHYRYDDAGHLVGESDFNGRSLTYHHDGADQLLRATDSVGRTTAFVHDLLGQLVERHNPDGSTTTMTYDERGLLTRIASHGRVLDHTLEYTYDIVGRQTGETVDGRSTTCTYDLLGRRTSRTTPSGITSTWTYDANSRPTLLAGRFGSLTFAYDANGQETNRFLGQGAALTQAWDSCHRLSAQSVWAYDSTAEADSAYTNLEERTYGYRADGMPAGVTDRRRGHRDFELTPAGRVTGVTAATWSERYAYDPLGNITQAHDTRRSDSATAGDRAYTGSLLRTAGRTAYEYDDRGRLVRRLARTLSGQRREWRYTWDTEDQLIRVDTPDRGSWAYGYDPLGRRTEKWRLDTEDGEEAERVVFAWDGTQLIEQHRILPDGSRHSITWDWEPDAWRPLSQTERRWDSSRSEIDRRFYAIVTDLVDAPSELITPDGRVAWAGDTDLWGRRHRGGADGELSCPLGRPGQYHDAESGLEYNYFRYYDPATGRYLSSDPLGLDAGPNPHAYVPNPLYWSDPLGLAGGRQPVGWGGSHYSLRPSNWTDGSDNNSYERNHIPARDAYLGIGTAKLGYGPGPAIRMDYDDHRNFISTGSGRASQAWRAKQADLIRQGKFDVAMKMDIGKIRKQYGTKYDAAIKEMVDSLPHNKAFQKYLSDNGWKLRTCLLQ
jgi:RHS repeat-associated protein